MSDPRDKGKKRKNVVPMPRPEDVADERLMPLCDSCATKHYPREEHDGACGHRVFRYGLRYCARCAVLKHICRACGADASGVFRRLHAERLEREHIRKQVFKKMLDRK